MKKKRIFPCVRCAYSTFKSRIAPKLKRLGYRDITDPYLLWDSSSIVAIWFDDNNQIVYNTDIMYSGECGRYICSSIREFLAEAEKLATEKGWYKEKTNEPDPLQEAAAPLIKFIKDNYGSNSRIIVTPTRADLVEEIECFRNNNDEYRLVYYVKRE